VELREGLCNELKFDYISAQPVIVEQDYTLHFIAGASFTMLVIFFLVTWLTRLRYNKKQLPLSQSQLSDEENILLDKSESTQSKIRE